MKLEFFYSDVVQYISLKDRGRSSQKRRRGILSADHWILQYKNLGACGMKEDYMKSHFCQSTCWSMTCHSCANFTVVLRAADKLALYDVSVLFYSPVLIYFLKMIEGWTSPFSVKPEPLDYL